MAVQQAPPFVSSMLDDATYDDEAGILTVILHDDEYTTPISAAQWQDFLNADSKGRWYRQNILGLVR